MQKLLKYFTMFSLIVIVAISCIIYLKQKEDLSTNDKFKTWIDINKRQFYDNEVINMQINMKYIGEEQEIDVYIPKYPFVLTITGDNGFQSVLEPPNTFGTQIHTFKKDDIITMDCSNYRYDYFFAFNVFKIYEQSESKMGSGGELKLPPGNYTLKLTTWYEDDLSENSRHELYSTEKITVKAKNNRKEMHEKKILNNFKLEANLDRNIYEVDEYIYI